MYRHNKNCNRTACSGLCFLPHLAIVGHIFPNADSFLFCETSSTERQHWCKEGTFSYFLCIVNAHGLIMYNTSI